MTPKTENGSADFLPGTLSLLILKALWREPLHGYAIAKLVRQASNDALAIEEGSLYPALNRMLVKGWIEDEWGVSEKNRRVRLYRLTEAGRRQLVSEHAEFERLVEAIRLVMRTA